MDGFSFTEGKMIFPVVGMNYRKGSMPLREKLFCTVKGLSRLQRMLHAIEDVFVSFPGV
jgi:hypothetical protein